ncbi:MAG: YihA family ribosome biogenesis GTP-binding protein [Lewinellaceae bacterium]|nr:YihA family ribosome biogenesis GTP-binding protein [Phaeodactylibacter sp.]MCB9349302.1 YihA family ribosome biogenesis GTP-binding protein [Lewinellaceae bacterium]
MDIKHTAFAGSYPSEPQCPTDGKPEYAFIGRSNVGKSSLVNMLTGRKNIAHISRTPGKTQLINYYLVNGEWYLVDLPGYGYARISKSKRREWRRMIEGYLQKRQTLQCAFILLDANVPPQQIDIDFINWLGKAAIPFVIVYTKTDRLKPEELEANVLKIQQALLEHWNELPQQFITSAVKNEGQEGILQFISEVNTHYFNTL